MRQAVSKSGISGWHPKPLNINILRNNMELFNTNQLSR